MFCIQYIATIKLLEISKPLKNHIFRVILFHSQFNDNLPPSFLRLFWSNFSFKIDKPPPKIFLQYNENILHKMFVVIFLSKSRD